MSEVITKLINLTQEHLDNDEEKEVIIDTETIVYGDGGVLDSISFVDFLMSCEEEFEVSLVEKSLEVHNQKKKLILTDILELINSELS